MLPETPRVSYRYAPGDNGYCIVPPLVSDERRRQLRSLIADIVEYAEQRLEDPSEAYYLLHHNDQGVLYNLYQRRPTDLLSH